MTRPLLEVFCDGSGAERVGRPGGWAFVIVHGDEVLRERSGGEAKTTCLVMELEAARAGLDEVVAAGWHRSHQVRLISDCRVALEVADGVFTPRPAKYAALTEALRALALTSGATTRWVRGHGGHRWNDHVDALARAARLAVTAHGRR
ncbi:MAG: hypothetical protein IAE78_17190 [Myxococcus sp.]|nr:hypothetical protein [Myxococcus sp.]